MTRSSFLTAALRRVGRWAALLMMLWGTHAEIHYDPAATNWVLRSGQVECRLRKQWGSLFLDYLGPSGGAAWKRFESFWGQGRQDAPWNMYDLAGQIEGRECFPADFLLVTDAVASKATNVDELRLVLRHRVLPLEVEARYTIWADTGVFTRQLTLLNKGEKDLAIDSLPSLAWRLPAGSYELSYLWGGWGRERQLVTEPLQAGRRSFVNRRGRSSNGYSPWFCVRNQTLGVRYLAQLAWSGNWQMSFERRPDHRPLEQGDLKVDLGMRFDSGGPLRLRPDRSFALPAVAFTASAGDLDDASNSLHRYQRQFVIPRRPGNEPPLVQFNSWYPFPGKMNVAEMKRCAEEAVQIGAEVFVLDAGWFNKKSWDRELGDWQADPVAFPNGLEELAKYVHDRGMKFGLWVEIENLGDQSRMFQEHPEWCLLREGKPLWANARHPLNFAKAEVRNWARTALDRLARGCQLDWVKIDYNIDVEETFDASGPAPSGDVLYEHLTGYYAWLDELRSAYPQLVIENCSSGGLRFDLGMLAHTHTTWLSDMVLPRASVQLAYGATIEFAPEVCNHWMVGDKENGEVALTSPPGWWDFMLRVPMNGQYGISSRIFDWSPELKQHAAAQVAFYKRLRPVMVGADVYHLTPPPSREDPKGWMALQYVAPDRKRSVVMAYRLGVSGNPETFKLRGLDGEKRYRVRREGEDAQTMSGRELADAGLRVSLEAEWRAAIVELDHAE